MITLLEKEFQLISNYIKVNYGINLAEKANLIEGRLQIVLFENGFSSFGEYFHYVITDPTGEAVTKLVNKITTNYTFFLRENDHFNFFRDKVLPCLKSVQQKTKDLKIWSAGCSTGDEPYTIAMIMADFLGAEKDFWNTKILATDISHTALETAINGIYTSEHIQNIPPNWRMNYFKKIDSDYAIVDRIKNEVIFRHFNLMNEVFPFKSRFHVIYCRNVMIYFDEKTKIDLINKFYEFTEPGGYLFIGHSESLGQAGTKYKYIMPAVYRKE